MLIPSLNALLSQDHKLPNPSIHVNGWNAQSLGDLLRRETPFVLFARTLWSWVPRQAISYKSDPLSFLNVKLRRLYITRRDSVEYRFTTSQTAPHEVESLSDHESFYQSDNTWSFAGCSEIKTNTTLVQNSKSDGVPENHIKTFSLAYSRQVTNLPRPSLQIGEKLSLSSTIKNTQTVLWNMFNWGYSVKSLQSISWYPWSCNTGANPPAILQY